jgi:protein SCO1/2
VNRAFALRLVAIAAVSFAATATVVALWPREASRTAEDRGEALIGGPFTLTDAEGKRRDDGEFRGRHMLVFFGFTHCPDFCPTALYSISLAMDRLGARAETLVPVFITLDPERDTPAQLKAYAQNFDKRVVMLTGGAAEIAAVAKAYRVYYAKKPLEKPGDYTIDHSAYIYLMGPNGKFLTHFRHAIAPDDLAKALQRHL